MSYTYTTLKTSIQDYTETSETSFISHMPDFILAAEERVFKSVDLEYFRKNVTGAFTSSDQYLSVPDDLLAPFSLQITTAGSETFLLEKDVNFIRDYTPNASTTGTPRYYARFDIDHFIVAPTPNSGYALELHYYYRPTSLTESQQTLTVALSSNFTDGETITGSTSGQTTITKSKPTTTSLSVVVPTGAFTVGETITGSTSGAITTISAIGSDTTTTWLSKNAINALLYGSVFEAYTYLKGEKDLLDLYNGRFLESVARLKDLGEARENADAYRRGLPQARRT
tara:strand:+ start:1691 stop:2542 length:852 start_codon:yes stop_codon:yes gene_type:complete